MARTSGKSSFKLRSGQDGTNKPSFKKMGSSSFKQGRGPMGDGSYGKREEKFS